MKKFFLPATLAATIIIIVGGIFLTSNRQSTNPTPLPLPSSYEYYWGDGCPHCANVEAFFESWDKKDQVKIDEKEVWKNPTNASLMLQRAKVCNLDTTNIAVPMLVTLDGQCFVGDTPIIDYLKSLSL
jgi:glutaredoxin